MAINKAPWDWVCEANTAFYESGAQNELDTRQEDWETAWLAKHGRDPEGNIDQEILDKRCAEFGLPPDEIKQCSCCDRLVWFADSWAPGHELLRSVCDAEVTGRKHPFHVDAMTMPPPPDVYPEVYGPKDL